MFLILDLDDLYFWVIHLEQKKTFFKWRNKKLSISKHVTFLSLFWQISKPYSKQEGQNTQHFEQTDHLFDSSIL